MKWIRGRLQSRRFRWSAGLTLLMASAAVVMIAAGPREVQRAPIPPQSAIVSYAQDCAYSDNYRMLVSDVGGEKERFLDSIAFQRGRLVSATSREILYEGDAPGLRFYVSYRCDAVPGSNQMTVETSTVVHYTEWNGRLYFFFVRPVHSLLMPWAVRHFVQKSLDRWSRPE